MIIKIHRANTDCCFVFLEEEIYIYIYIYIYIFKPISIIFKPISGGVKKPR